ncbi:hypothetical protein L917_02706 [Phytophthora nicotianae]|uniref:Uncharacterized protein n=1 Tax=Phytophthora nicotianae TaxID=4792 RepID=W2LT04_PHYNI|nr:hypothetical protein L917_02706 [Phytophthora nicotianae]
MPRRSKTNYRKRLQLLHEAGSAAAAAESLSVHQSSLYRWKKYRETLQDAAQTSLNKYYVDPSTRSSLTIRHPALDKRLLDWITDMRKNTSLCVSADGMLLMLSKYNSELF